MTDEDRARYIIDLVENCVADTALLVPIIVKEFIEIRQQSLSLSVGSIKLPQ